MNDADREVRPGLSARTRDALLPLLRNELMRFLDGFEALQRLAVETASRADPEEESLHAFLETDGEGLASARDFVPGWSARHDAEANAALAEAQPPPPSLAYARVDEPAPAPRTFERMLAFLVPRLEELAPRAATHTPPPNGLGQLDTPLARARTALDELEERQARKRALERQESLQRRGR